MSVRTNIFLIVSVFFFSVANAFAGVRVFTDSTQYSVAPGSTYTVQIFLDADDLSRGVQPLPNGLVSYGVRLSYDPKVAKVSSVESITVPAELNFTASEKQGATKAVGDGYAAVKGSISPTAKPYFGTLIATFTIQDLNASSTYPITTSIYRVVKGEQIFFDGAGKLLDSELALSGATVVITAGNTGPVFNPTPAQSVAEGDNLKVVLSATDREGDELKYDVSGLPSFATFSGDTIVFAPGFEATGSYTIGATVTDGQFTDKQSFVLTVTNTNRVPILDSIKDASVAEGATITVARNAVDPDGDNPIYSYSALPVFAKEVEGGLFFQPGFSDAGTYPITVTATDSTNSKLFDSKTFNLIVTNINRGPTLAAIADQAVAEGASLSITLSGSDPDNDLLIYSAANLPSFVTLATNVLTVKPGFSDAGSYKIVAATSDGSLADSKSFTIIVTATNRAPVLDPVIDQTVAEGASLTLALNAKDPDGDIVTYTASGLPTFASMTGGQITFAPGFSDAGSYPLRVTASDGKLSDSKSFNLVVSATNRAPILTAVADLNVAEGATASITLSAKDPDGDTVVLGAENLPSFATITGATIQFAPGFEAAGSYTIRATASDGKLIDGKSFVVIVSATNRAPELAAIAAQSVAENGNLIIDLLAKDADGDTLTFGTKNLPPFAILSGSQITVTPSFENAGSYTIDVTVSDGKLGDSKPFTLTVTPTNRVPLLSTIADVNVAEGSAATVILSAKDPDGDSVTYDATNLPTFATRNGDAIQFAPGFSDAGSYTVRATASDGKLTASQSFNVKVSATNRAPELALIAAQSVAENNSLTIALSAKDSDGDSLTYSAINLPAFASLSGSQITLTPGFSDAGTYNITASASDGKLIDSKIFVLTVTNTNRAPLFKPAIGDRSVAEGASLTLDLTGVDSDGDAITYTTSGLPAFVTLLGTQLIVTPGYSDAGLYAVTVTASDGKLSASDKFTLTVTATNRAPILSAIADLTVAEASQATITLSATDPDGDPVSYSSADLPSFAKLSAAQIVVAPGFSDAGSYKVNVTASDGKLSHSRAFNIIVTGTNRAPVFAPIGDQTVAEGASLTLALSAPDPDGDVVSFSASGLPSFATLNGGQLVFNPSFNHAGSYSINVTASDGKLTDIESFTLVVGGTNRAPVLAAIADVNIAESGAATVTLSATDPDGDPITYDATNLPLFATRNGATIQINPGFDHAGSYTVRATASDGTQAGALTVSRSFIINVAATNRAPDLALISNQSVAENASLIIDLPATDPDGDTLTYNVTGLPIFASLSGSQISVKPGFADAGNYAIGVSVSDGKLTDGQSFTLTVSNTNRAPLFKPALADQTMAEGSSLALPLTAQDPDGDNITYNFSGLPTFATAAGSQITFNPGFTAAGSYPISVTASDGKLTATQSFTLLVTDLNRAPSLSVINDLSVAEGSTATVTLSATDPEGDVISYDAQSLPAFATRNGNIIQLAPGFDHAGIYSVRVTATDGKLSDNRSFTITVLATNRAPELNPIGSQAVAENSTLMIEPFAKDSDGDSVTYSAAGLPAFANFSNGKISVTPGFSDAGSYPVTVTASDGKLSDSETFTLVVGGTNRAPALSTIADVNIAEGSELSVKLIAIDPDNDPITYGAQNLPIFATRNGDSILLKPGYSDAGSYTVRATASDGTLSDSKSFTIRVAATNRAPELSPISAQSVAENGALSIALIAKDPDGDTLTYSSNNLPIFASLVGAQINLNPGYDHAGSYDITVTASDGSLSHSQSFKLSVTPTNRAPVFKPSIADQTLAEGNNLALTLAAQDPDGDTVNYSASGLPAFATLTGSQIIFAPSFSDAGSYAIRVTASDGKLNVDAAFTLVVTGTNRAPVLSAIADISLAEASQLTLTLSATDPDGDVVTFSATNLPAFATLSGAQLTLAPGYDHAGSYTLNLSASDGKLSHSRSIKLTVTPTNRAPVIDLISEKNVAEGSSITVTLNAVDPDGDPITFSASGLPAFASLIGSQLTFAPGFSDAGRYTVNISVSDSKLSHSTSFVLVVGGTNRAPSLTTIANLSVAEAAKTTINLAATDPDGDTLTYSSTTLPAFTKLVGAQISVAPGYEDAGSYLVTITVSDGKLSDSKSFTLTIIATNRAPVLEPIADKTMAESQSLTVALSALDPDGDQVSYDAIDLPAFAVLNGSQLVFTPTFNDAGRYTMNVSASDGKLTASRSFTLVVGGSNRVPSLTAITDVNLAEGAVATVTLIATDPDGDDIFYGAQNLPAFATLAVSSSGATIQLAPGYDHAGSYKVTATASDGSLSDSKSFTINVTATNRAPELITVAAQSVAANSRLTVAVLATDPDGDSVTYSANNLPPFVTLLGTQLSVNPSFDHVGRYTISVTASDGKLTDTQSFVLVVVGSNAVPELDLIADVKLAEGGEATVTLHATDPDNDPITYSTENLPAFATLNGAVLQLKPGYSDAGSYAVTAIANDGSLSDSQSFTIIVSATNRAPVLTAIPAQTLVEKTSLTVGLNAVDPDGDALAYTAIDLPAFATLLSTEIVFVPGVNDAGLYNISVTTSDGLLNSTQSFVLTVTDFIETDTDGDGVADAQDTDDDNDGMPDACETQFDLNPLDPADAHADRDGDQVSNVHECLLGTDPNNPDSGSVGANLFLSDGPINVSTTWQSTTHNRYFNDPVVLLGVLSNRDPAPVTSQLGEVNGNGFDIRLATWADQTPEHGDESLSYLVAEKGHYRMANGIEWEAGTLDIAGLQNWSLVKFNQAFAGQVAVFTTIQSRDMDIPLISKVDHVSRNGFDAALFSEEAVRSSDVTAKVGYIAISLPAPNVMLDLHGNLHGNHDVTFSLAFELLSSVFRQLPVDKSIYPLGLVEETSLDEEMDHIEEMVAVLQLNNNLFGHAQTRKERDTFVLRRDDSDVDGDGLYNTIDPDSDNDGVVNELDDLPLDATDSADTDKDGNGNKIDLDDDGDLIPDTAEITLGLNPLDPADALEDMDNDGINNLDEYSNGTDLNVDSTPPVVTAPADITVASTGPLTPVNLGVANAVDQVDGILVPSVNQLGPYTPGRHLLSWTATDKVGLTSVDEQIITVIPQVNLSAAQTAGEGSTITITATLNGNALTYPLEIPFNVFGSATAGQDYQLSAASFLITSGVTASISLELFDDGVVEGAESFVLSLQDVSNPLNNLNKNVIPGTQKIHTVSIIEENLAPRVKLTAKQRGSNTILITRDGGIVELSVEVTDANPHDHHQVDWSEMDSNFVNLSASTVNNSFAFDPANLSTGIYRLTVTATDDGLPAAADEDQLTINIINNIIPLSINTDTDNDGITDSEEGFGDLDSDGVPDYADTTDQPNLMQAQLGEINKYLLQARLGLTLKLGTTALAGGANTPRIDNGIFTAFGGNGGGLATEVIDAGFDFPLGIFDFEVADATVGESVSIVIPLQDVIPPAASYRKYFSATGWQDFIQNEKNFIKSAAGVQGVCPSSDDTSYQVGLTVGYYCIQLTIEDGGPNDADGIANGVVVDPGGIATTFDDFVIATGASLGNQSVAAKSPNVEVLSFVINSPTDGAELTSILLTAVGTGADDQDVKAVTLYQDLGALGRLTPSDIELGHGTFSVDNGTLELPLTAPLILHKGENHLLVVYDF